MRQTFRQEEAEQILKKALSRAAETADARSHEVSQEQLVAMAAELGVDPATVEAAAQEWRAEQEQRQEREAFIAERRQGFLPHLLSYVGVNAFLILLNLFTDTSHFWAIYPLLGWGIGMFSHAVSVLPTKGGFEQAFREWRETKQSASASSEQTTGRRHEMKTILGSFTILEPIQPQKPWDPRKDKNDR